MGFTVQDMLDMKLFQKANLLWGKGGTGQEIRGVTIIESPDIVRFISGGEVLLTGLNTCSKTRPTSFCRISFIFSLVICSYFGRNSSTQSACFSSSGLERISPPERIASARSASSCFNLDGSTARPMTSIRPIFSFLM